MPDVVQLITAQHKIIDRLLQRTQEEGADVGALVRQVADLLVPHSEAESSFVYPEIQRLEPAEGEQVHDGTAEHEHVEGLLRELLGEEPGSPGYDGKLAALIGELRHHVEEEESDLLPVLARKASQAERDELGERFARATGGAGVDEAPGSSSDMSRAELYEKAKEQDVPGRSNMTKEELADAVHED